MASSATIAEKYQGLQLSCGDNPTLTVQYIISNAVDENDALYALGTTDIIRSGLPRTTTVVTKQIDSTTWEGSVEYSLRKNERTRTDPEETFDISGTSENIKYSKQCVGMYGPLNQSYQPKGPMPIRVTHSGVEGIEVDYQVYTWTETHYMSAALVTPAYKYQLYLLYNCVNNNTFRSWAEGCVRFRGAQGQMRPQMGDWQLQFKFEAQQNRTNIPIFFENTQVITVLSKKAWEYLDVKFIDVDSDDGTGTGLKTISAKPVMAYVHQIFDEADFSLLGIGTGPTYTT
jgi:hypothetical protein